jgi:hypothetical protein
MAETLGSVHGIASAQRDWAVAVTAKLDTDCDVAAAQPAWEHFRFEKRTRPGFMIRRWQE